MKTYGRRRGTNAGGSAQGEVEVVNLDEVCRLCLSREERDEHRVPIFENQRDEPVPLSLRIMACVALEVVEDDGLPATICRPCHYQLEKYYIFRKKCKSSDIKLRMHLKRLADSGAVSVQVEDDDSEFSMRPKNEQDLVGASVTIAIPEDGEGDMEIDGQTNEIEDTNHFTLPPDSPNDTRQACTLKQEILEDDDKDEERHIIIEKSETSQEAKKYVTEMEENEMEAEESTMNAETGGDEALSVRVLPSAESSSTHVEVTTEDGSVLVMELTTEEEPVLEQNDAGEFLVFKCDQCPKAFSRMVDLKRHSSVHNMQRGMTCSVCEKWFPSHSSYARHERVHTGVKPYQCSICERRFIQKEILLRHMLVHSELKPFNCNICKKGFTQRDALRTHLTTHEPNRTVRLHRCPLCPKVFCHASGLSRHVLVHAGRVYKCLDCEKLFNDKSSLRRHHKISGHQAT